MCVMSVSCILLPSQTGMSEIRNNVGNNYCSVWNIIINILFDISGASVP
jgi:hypothetical protein